MTIRPCPRGRPGASEANTPLSGRQLITLFPRPSKSQVLGGQSFTRKQLKYVITVDNGLTRLLLPSYFTVILGGLRVYPRVISPAEHHAAGRDNQNLRQEMPDQRLAGSTRREMKQPDFQ
jgi:hypothetical protein